MEFTEEDCKKIINDFGITITNEELFKKLVDEYDKFGKGFLNKN